MKIIKEEFLPSKTITVHAASIAFWDNNPVFAWFGGIREGLSDSSIYIYYLNKLYRLPKVYNLAYWNPVLFTYDDCLYLFFKIGEFCDRWQTFYIKISDTSSNNFDKNIAFDKWQCLPAGLNGPVKTKPIIKDNLIYCGSSVETRLDWTSYVEVYKATDDRLSFINRSRPLTVPKIQYTNSSAKLTNTMGIIQPSLFLINDRLNAFFRSSNGLNKIYYSYIDSDDEDYYRDLVDMDSPDFSDPVPTNLPNPNSGIDTLFSSDNRLFVIYNNDKTYRYPLVISEIKDSSVFPDIEIANTCVIKQKIENDDITYSDELSYPYMIEHKDKIHCVYTYGRSKIMYVILEK